MTSGNLSEDLIAIDNREAVDRLGGIADFFLVHDREILLRCVTQNMCVASPLTVIQVTYAIDGTIQDCYGM